MAQRSNWVESFDSPNVSDSFLSNFPPNHAYDHRPSIDLSATHHAPLFANYNARLTGANGPGPAAPRRISAPQGQASAAPLARMFSEQGPYAPQGIGDPAGHGAGLRFKTPGNPVMRAPAPNAHYPDYREGPLSNHGSSHITDGHGGGAGAGGGDPVDSAYGTGHEPTKSIASAVEYANASLDGSQSFHDGFERMQLQQGIAPSWDHMHAPHQQPVGLPPYEEPGLHAEHEDVLTCEHPECRSVAFKNQSELRKHQQRHEKAHRCDVPNCSRKEGFQTKNDLDRHKKSKHGIRPPNCNDRSYRCAAQKCNKRNKLWPRLDNFKAHCARMHQHENIDQLLKHSEVEALSPSPELPASSQQSQQDAIQRERPELMASQDTLLADLSCVPQDPHVGHLLEPSPPRNKEARCPMDVAMTDDGRQLRRSAAATRYAETPRPVSRQQRHQAPTATADASSWELHRSPNAANNDFFSNSNVRELALGESQPPASKKRKLSFGGSVTTAEQAVEEASRSIMAELQSGQRSADSLQSVITARMREFLEVAVQQAAGRDGDGNGDVDGNGELAAKQKRLECRICHKMMDRPCDLKKHEKRHSRPWGCTHEKCHRTFGSKNDWKRHENSQHYQLETWRCHEPSPASRIGECARLFLRRDPFLTHLRKDHNLSDDNYVREQCRQRRVGRNFQNGFWCGFCRRIVRLHTKGLEAWDERFNHIDDEHYKQGRCIDDWFPMGRDVPKGSLPPPRDHPDSSHGSSSAVFDDESASESELDADDARRVRTRRSHGQTLAAPLDAVPAPENPSEKLRPAKDNRWSCENCGQGFFGRFDGNCMECGHKRPEGARRAKK